MTLFSWLDRIATDREYVSDRDVFIFVIAFYLGMFIMGVAWIWFG